MARKNNNDNSDYPETTEKLLDEMQHGRYGHLQIILSRTDKRSLGLGQVYLAVTNNGFGLYQLRDIEYSYGIIQLELKSMTSDEVACVPL